MTHKLYFLSALTMTALLASGCLEDPVVPECTTPGQLTCINKEDGSGLIRVCQSESWVNKEPCPNGCDVNNNKCLHNDITKNCTDGTSQCSSDGKKLQKCTDGEWKDDETCPNGCEGNKCKTKPDDHVTDNVCTAGARRCGSDGKTPELCEENAWKPQSTCEYGCIGNGECRICKEEAKSCDAEGKRPRVCHNNTWEDQAICPNGLSCVNGECGCPEGWQTCEGAEGCFDLANDANNCGACGTVIDTNNGNCLCKNSEACIATGGGSFIFHSCGTTECCDPEAEKYIYLSGRSDCLNPGTSIFADASAHQFSTNHSAATTSATYCLKADDIAKYYPLEKDNCFALESESTHLWNADECGTKAPYQKCEVLNSMNENIQTCDLGRCCIEGIGDSHEVCNNTQRRTDSITCSADTDFKGSDCCSGYAYLYASIGSSGYHIHCTDNANECQESCGSDDCRTETHSCKML